MLNDKGSKILKLTIPQDRPLNTTELTNILGWWDDRRAHLKDLKDYYDLHHEIEDRVMFRSSRDPETGERIYGEDKKKPNNKLIHDFPGYITDVFTGYFMGKPVSYTVEKGHEAALERLQEILDYNDEAAHNINLAMDQSIFGTAFEVLWTEKPAWGILKNKLTPRFNTISPLEGFVVYDPDSMEDVPIAAFRVIHIWDILEQKYKYMIEEYTEELVYTYSGASYAELICDNPEGVPHNFKQVPIIEYPNNKDRCGDFERVISLIDAYDKLNSDGLNESEGFRNSLLHVRNMMGTNADDIREMQESGVVKTEDEGTVEYITKPDSSGTLTAQEAILSKNIHKFSKVPPMDDQNFAGNVSGEAMKYKLWGIETVTSTKERLFKKSLIRRVEIIFELFIQLKGDSDFDFTYLGTKFTRNIPRNLSELVDQINKLKGMVSKETLLSWHPDIDDPAAEVIKANEENQMANPYNPDFVNSNSSSNDNNTNDDKNNNNNNNNKKNNSKQNITKKKGDI